MPGITSDFVFDGGKRLNLGFRSLSPEAVNYLANPVNMVPKPWCDLCKYSRYLLSQLGLWPFFLYFQKGIGQLMDVSHDLFLLLVNLQLQNKTVFLIGLLHFTPIAQYGIFRVIYVRQQFCNLSTRCFG